MARFAEARRGRGSATASSHPNLMSKLNFLGATNKVFTVDLSLVKTLFTAPIRKRIF